MTVRESKEYQEMSMSQMFQLTWNDPESDEEALAFWQKMVDTGFAWKLEGWFGRQAMAMIEEGLIER
jgi:hypothetical protein